MTSPSAPWFSRCLWRSLQIASRRATASAVFPESSIYTDTKGPCAVTNGRKRSDSMIFPISLRGNGVRYFASFTFK